MSAAVSSTTDRSHSMPQHLMRTQRLLSTKEYVIATQAPHIVIPPAINMKISDPLSPESSIYILILILNCKSIPMFIFGACEVVCVFVMHWVRIFEMDYAIFNGALPDIANH